MPDYVFKLSGLTLDPKHVKKELLALQDKVQETIARDIRQRLSDFLFTLRKVRSERKSQLAKYVPEGLASALTEDNAFDGAQARVRKITHNGKPAWIVTVTRGKHDKERGLNTPLFDVLDKGSDGQTFSGVRIFPTWTPSNRKFSTETLDVGERVQINVKRNHKGKLVPVFARAKNSLKGFEGYGFYKTAVAMSKRQLIGTVVKSPDGSLQYTITAKDYQVEFIKGDE